MEEHAILSLNVSLTNTNVLIYTGTNKSINLYDTQKDQLEKSLEGSNFGINESLVVEKKSLKYGDGEFLFFGLSNNENSVRIWDSKSGKEVAFIKDTENFIMNNFNTGPKMQVMTTYGEELRLIVLNSADFDFSFTVWDINFE